MALPTIREEENTKETYKYIEEQMIRLLDVPTRLPLPSLIKSMLRWIDATKTGRQYNEDMVSIYKGDISRFVDKQIRLTNGAKGYKRLQRTKVVVNPIKAFVDKLSKVYTDGVVRTTENPVNQEILDQYQQWLCIDSNLQDSTEFQNLTKHNTLMPYIQDGRPGLRVLTGSEAIPYSDNEINDAIPTVMIMPRGTAYSYQGSNYTSTGQKERTVKIYRAYSTTEIIIFDSDEKLRPDLMLQEGLLETIVDETGVESVRPVGNPFGIIPFLYINESNKDLIPTPDSDLMTMALDASLQYSNLNAALQFQAGSILAGIDLESDSFKNIEWAANTVWDLRSEDKGREGSPNGSLQVIKPEVDIAGVIQALESKWQFFLSSRGLTPPNVSGETNVQQFASGVDRLIAESGATSLYRQQITNYKDVERVFWRLLAVMHNTWVRLGLMTDERRGLTEDVEVETKFTVAQPNFDENTLTELLITQLNERLTSRKRALRRLYPDLTTEEIDALIVEIDAEGTNTRVDGAFNMLQAADRIRTEMAAAAAAAGDDDGQGSN